MVKERKGEGSSVAKIILVASAVLLATGVAYLGKGVYDEKSLSTKVTNELTKSAPDISNLSALGVIDSTKVSTGSELSLVSSDGITGTKTFKLTNVTDTGAVVVGKMKKVSGLSVGNVSFDGTNVTFTTNLMGESVASVLSEAPAEVNYAVSQILNGSDFAILNSVDKISDGYVLGGMFSGNVKLGTYEATTSPSMQNHYFIAKLANDGSVSWVKSGVAMSGLMRKGTDGIYVVLTHMDTVTWADFSNSASGTDVIIVKYGFDGTFLYKNSISGNGSQNAVVSFVGSDGDMNVLLWSDSGYSLGGDSLTSGLNIIKLTASNGNVAWVKSGIGESSGMARLVDGGNGSVVMGYSGNGMLGSQDSIVRKVNGNGTDEFSTQFGSTGAEHTRNVAVDSSGNIYVLVGGENFYGSQGPTFNMIYEPAVNFTKIGDWENYLVKLSPTGTLIWAKQIAGAGASVGYSSNMGMSSADVIVDSSGNAYVYGVVGGANITVPATITKGTGDDGFVIKFDTAGNVAYSAGLDNGSDNNVSRLVAGGSGEVFGIQSTLNMPASNFTHDLFKFNAGGGIAASEALGAFSPVTLKYEGGHVLSVINHGNGMGNPFTYQTETFTPLGLQGATFLRVNDALEIK